MVFGKGYTDYSQYHQWNLNGEFFVNRQKDNAAWQLAGEYEIDESVDPGVLKDE